MKQTNRMPPSETKATLTYIIKILLCHQLIVHSALQIIFRKFLTFVMDVFRFFKTSQIFLSIKDKSVVSFVFFFERIQCQTPKDVLEPLACTRHHDLAEIYLAAAAEPSACCCWSSLTTWCMVYVACNLQRRRTEARARFEKESGILLYYRISTCTTCGLCCDTKSRRIVLYSCTLLRTEYTKLSLCAVRCEVGEVEWHWFTPVQEYDTVQGGWWWWHDSSTNDCRSYL